MGDMMAKPKLYNELNREWNARDMPKLSVKLDAIAKLLYRWDYDDEDEELLCWSDLPEKSKKRTDDDGVYYTYQVGKDIYRERAGRIMGMIRDD